MSITALDGGVKIVIWNRIEITIFAAHIFALVLTVACVNPANQVAPMPPVPEGVCDAIADPGEAGGAAGEVLTPTSRVLPLPPKRALNRGIQGWACVEFTITKSGTVEDVMVIASEPEGYFEDAATDAIRQWKYNPKMKDGQAFERTGVRKRFNFVIQY